MKLSGRGAAFPRARRRVPWRRPWPGLALAAAALWLAAVAGPAGLQAQQGIPQNIAELKRIIAVRDAQQAGAPGAAVSAAEEYLAQFPEGRYADEALLALGDAHADQDSAEPALAAYDRLIEAHPESPFREQAMVSSLPLLREQERLADAFTRVDTLAREYPRSLHRDTALLWKARVLYERGDSPGAAETLERVERPEDLSRHDQTVYYRVATLSRLETGREVGAVLERYLEREDSDEHKAAALRLVAEEARAAGREAEALEYYELLVERYPSRQYLSEALYWRAELYYRTKVEPAEGMQRSTRAPQAIGYYSAYLDSGEGERKARALVRRASLREALGLKEEALRDYERAAERDPALAREPDILMARMRLYAGLGRHEEATALLDEARANPEVSDERLAGLQLEVAAIYYQAERCGQVEALLSPMPLFTDPSRRSRASFMRGFCRYREGQYEQATFDLEGLVNDPAYQDLVIKPLLTAYEESGQYSRLTQLGEELLRSGRAEPSEALLTRMARAYEEMGEPGLMLSVYRRLEQEHPEAVQSPAIQYQLGAAEQAMGNTDKALRHYRAVLDAQAESEEPPGEPYLRTVEHLQTLYAGQGDFEALVALNERAAEALGDDAEAEARLARWRRDTNLAWGRHALAQGDASLAVSKLSLAWEQTPEDDEAARIELLGLLVRARARHGSLGEALELYAAELERGEDEAYGQRVAQAMAGVLLGEDAPPLAEGGRDEAEAVYKLTLEHLPTEDRATVVQLADRLDALYREAGDHAGRAALITFLLKDGLDEEARDRLEARKSRVYLAWGRATAEEGQHEAAVFHYERALERIPGEDWRRRYEIVSAMSRSFLAQERYAEIVLRNEEVLAHIDDPELESRLRHFLGQVYLEWARAAQDGENWKSTRIRSRYALDYLDGSDWQRRLAATNALAKALQNLERPADAAAAYEAVLDDLPQGQRRQQYALYLGRLYKDTLEDAAKARKWFQAADRGGNDALSLEAGYQLSGLDVEAQQEGRAIERLEGLVERGLADSKWRVPIHYRLAVLYHQRRELEAALRHYQQVAGEQSAELRELYPRSITQSRAKAAEIGDYLEATGGQRGADIAVPSVDTD